MQKIKMLFIVLFILVGCTTKGSSRLRVGVIQFGDFASLNDVEAGLELELEGLDIDVIIKSAQGESANVQTIATQFVDDKVDLIVAITTQAAQSAAAVSNGEIPVVFAAVSDPKSAGVMGLDFVTGVSDAAPLEAQFDLIEELTPNVKSIGVLFKTGDPNGIYQTERIQAVGAQRGYEVVVKGAMEVSDLSISATSLAEQVDAFYLITDGLIVGNTGVIVEEAKRAGIPSYASEDGQLEYGVLASNSISYKDIGKQVGVIVKRILLDKESPKDIDIEVANKTYPQISREIAEMFELEVPESLKQYLFE